MTEEDFEKKNEQAPFNMALDTLKSIRKLIDKIALLSIGIVDGVFIDRGEIQHAKYYAVEQLTIISVPLLDPEQNKKVKEEFEKIKIGWVRTAGTQYKSGKIIPAMISEAEKQLNNIIRLVQEELQIKGHFMPSKSESDMF